MKLLLTGSILIFLLSCTKKDQASDLPEKTPEKKTATAVVAPEPVFTKELREAIYFSNSLEREALKLILKDRSLQKLTLFSVLSYIVETNSGAKKTTPPGLDCGTFEMQTSPKLIRIFKSCVKPRIEIADIRTIEENAAYEVDFMTRDLAAVVGMSVALTGSNITCRMKVRSKKLSVLSCDNWSYQTGEDQISSTLVRASEFNFQRDAQKQFVIKGGFFKELVETRKINILVPLEGKIKIFEKEIKVIDEFAEKKKEEVLHESKEKSQKGDSEKNNEKSGEKSDEENGEKVDWDAQEPYKKTGPEGEAEGDGEKKIRLPKKEVPSDNGEEGRPAEEINPEGQPETTAPGAIAPPVESGRRGR